MGFLIMGNKTYPREAGLARIQYLDERRPDRYEQDLPFCKGTDIFLPKCPEMGLHELQNGKQFLVKIPAGVQGTNCNQQWWFGGTDKETVFLSRLDPTPFDIFKEKGEEAFYQSLKPQLIKSIEREFDVDSDRQGDIWAAPIPYTWEEFERLFLLFQVEAVTIQSEPKKVESFELLNTRHRLDGLYIIREAWTPWSPPRQRVFAEGTITAPDHPPMTLEGIYIVAQTEHLFNAPTAD